MKEETPAISIIILNYNGQKDLESCLPSLADVNYPKDKLEIIVVDNASSDESIFWLAQNYPNVRLQPNSTNVGFAGGINSGAAIASGDYLAFLNADMRVDKAWLMALVETIGNREVVCAGSVVLDWAGEKIDYAGRPEDALNLCPQPPRDVKDMLEAAYDGPILFASGGAMLVQRDTFLTLGGFDEDYFLYNEDVDFGWRLWLSGFRVLRSSRSIVFHHGGAASKQLAPEFVFKLAQKYSLYTVFKDMEENQLGTCLPSVIWYLVNRSRWLIPAKHSLDQAIEELLLEIERVWQKRIKTQSERVRSDEEIFSLCGHPFAFLLKDPNYSAFQDYLQRHKELTTLPKGNTTVISNHLRRLLYHAYKFNYEILLEQTSVPLVRKPSLENSDQIIQNRPSQRHSFPPRLDGETALSQLTNRAEQSARQLLSPELRHYLAPTWRRIKRKVLQNPSSNLQSTSSQRHPQVLKPSILQLQDYIGVHFDRFQRTPYLVGVCNICGNHTVFFCGNKALYRESLFCAECLTTSRYRSIARGILRAIKELTGHDAKSIAGLDAILENVSVKIYDTQVSFYTETHAYPIPDLLSKLKWIDLQQSIYLPAQPWGAELSPKVTNQNLECLTFPDNSFDIVITSDVMEHVRLDEPAYLEIRRVLRPGGFYVFTVPHFRNARESIVRVAVPEPSDPSKDLYLMEKEYHGDINSAEGTALSYRAYGTEIDDKLRELGFTVDYSAQDFVETAIMNTELFYCRLSK